MLFRSRHGDGRGGHDREGFRLNPNAPVKEQVETLRQMIMKQERRLSGVQREGRELVEGVRAEFRRELDDVRAVGNSIIGQMRESETRSARTDARGIAVVVVGIVLTGVPDGLARFAPVGWTFIAAAVATAAAVGIRVIRDER